MKRPLVVSALFILSLASGAVAQGSMAMGSTPHDMTGIRAALEKYQDPVAAVRDGFYSTVGCVDFPTPGGMGDMQYPKGGMGVHFINMANVGPQLDTLKPQVLIYQPDRAGRLTLVAAEWFVPTQLSANRPTLFGHPMDGPMEGHAPIMPPELHHWDLHVWLWKNNPAGMFMPTNPTVSCPNGAPYTYHDTPPHMVTSGTR